MSNAVSGHGALLAMEQDPDGAQGTFTTIAELNGDLNYGLSRTETDVTPHNEDIDTYVLGVLRREAMTFSVNFIFDSATHDHSTGLQYALHNNQTRGFRLRGPDGTTDSNEIIASGKVQQFMRTFPVREGAASADVAIRFSGPFIVDGDTVGNL